VRAALVVYGPFVALFGAFWAALLLYRARTPEGDGDTRLLAGLGLSAVLAHLGWVAMNPVAALAEPALVLDPTRGVTVLFVPLGPLVVAPWRGPRPALDRFLASSLGALPLSLSVARLGCLIGGCCHGVPTSLPWGIVPAGGDVAVHPIPIYEMGLLVALHFMTRAVSAEEVPAFVLAGLGAIRIAVEPFRAAPPLGDPLVAPWVIALLWIATSLVLRARSRSFRGAPRLPHERRAGPDRWSLTLGPGR
jgi:hypothetical protein